MDRPMSIVVLISVLLVGYGVAALHRQLRKVLTNQEIMMADFTGLDQDLADIPAAIAAAATRIQDAFDKATAADADQAQVDAAKTQLDQALAGINALGAAVVPATDPNADPNAGGDTGAGPAGGDTGGF